MRYPMVVLVFAFWAVFWGLNGFDKFVNGTSATNTAVTSGVVLDAAGAVRLRVHPTQSMGWYGVTRDPKFIAYFRTLHLSPHSALTVLCAIGVSQVLLFALFAALLWRSLRRTSRSRFADEVLPRLGFKASALIFIGFIGGDIMFGDRMEVWEHGTYLILVLASWDLWHRAVREFPALAAPEATAPAPRRTAVPA
ncbi:MAG: hypothetical protein ACT4P4_27800 [Betaproteobacteria bacterium]